MATTPTNKPIPSEDPRDLKFNAGKIDEVVNSDNDSYTDRFGKTRITVSGFEKKANNKIDEIIKDTQQKADSSLVEIENRAEQRIDTFIDNSQVSFDNFMSQSELRVDNFIQNSGYSVIGDYYNGPLTINDYNEVIKYQWSLYKLKIETSLPFVTSGRTDESWLVDSSKFYAIDGDAILRQELSSNAHGSGASLIGMTDGYTVQESINYDRKSIFELNKTSAMMKGFNLVDGSFESGATVNSVFDAVICTTDGNSYYWTGSFPNTIPPKSSPSDGWEKVPYKSVSSISVMSFIPDSLRYVVNLGFNSAQSSGVDLLPYINKAQSAAKSLGAELTFPGGYFPVSDTVKQIDGCQVRGTPKKTFIIPTNSFPANKWLWVWPIRSGAPQKSLRDMGFQGASGHTDQSAKRVGGFAIKSGNWHSDVSGISIRNCFYGGVLINPQHPTSSGGTSDCVNLKLDHFWILDAGAIDYHQCFEIDIKNVDTDDTYAEDSSFAPPYSPGSWTDGAIRDMDLSACDTDPANPDTAGPYAMKLTGPSTVYTMFNVLVERIFTATRRQTHIYVDMPNLYNCTFSNFSGETHAGVSGVSADASGGNFNVFHVNLINAGSWNSFYDFYANASLGNNGLFVGNVDAATFHNMTIDVNYIGSELDDTGEFPRQITVANTARNIAFENCNVRRLERNDWFVTYKQYDIFTNAILDDGFNTTFNSTQLKSVVPTFKPLNWFTSIGRNGLPVNGGSGTVGRATLVQGSNITLNAILPAQAATEVNWYYDRSDFAPSYLKRIFVSLNIEVNSVDEAAGHYIKVGMFGQSSTIQIPAAFVGKRIPILLNFTYNTNPELHKLAISLGSTGTASSNLNVTIRDFIVSPICYAYFPRYTSVISEYGLTPMLKGNNNFSGTNTFDSNNTYIGKNAANTGIGLHVGSTTTAGTSFIDMYSAGSSNAQARIATTGGNGTPYSGGLSFTVASLTMGASVIPNITNAKDLGSSSVTWRNIYSQNAVTVVSDENYKDEIQGIPDELLDAWADIKYSMWKMKSAINEKGRDNARYHFGIIAQHVRDVLASHGLDWEKYGLVTYEKWDAEEAEYAISPAEYAEDGTVVKEQSITEIKPRKEAGEIYMLRMEECMAVEAAYLRRKIEMLTQG